MPTTTGKATDFIQFSRASSATVVDSDGKIKWAPHNLLSNSESFDASAWGKYLTTVAANTQVAPNGTTTADTVTASSGNDVHRVQRASGETTAASTNYTLSVYVKAGTHNFVTIGHYGASEVFVAATFNLSSGTTATETDVGTTSGTVVSTEKVDIGSGWFRLSITGNHNGTSSQSFVCFAQAATGNSYTNFGQPVVNLAGTETFHLWGAHLYRSDLGGMQANTSAYPMYNPTTPKNLLGFSEDFSNGTWMKVASTVTTNAILAPNGLQTADKIVATNSASTTRGVYQSVTPVSGGRYVTSVYAKTAEYDKLTISEIGAGRFGASFDLTAQTATSLGGAGYVSSNITSVGDGWFRCSVVWTASGGVAIAFAGYPTGATVNTAGVSYAGDGVSGIYLWGAQLSDSASIDPYSPVYGAAPTAAAYYGPRRDFDPVTLACKGLLVEEQRTNLMLHSAAFDNAAWTKYELNSTGTPAWVNVGTAPDGTSTAEKLIETTANDVHCLYLSQTLTATAYTFSVYAKAAERSILWLRLDPGTLKYAYFNLSSGVTSNVDAAYTASITAVGGGWYRCSITTTGTAASYTPVIGLTTASGTAAYAGDGTSGLLIWGAQLEAGSFATSYIPTGSATATRSADVASVSTQAFPYSSTEGALVVSATTFSTVATSGRYAGLGTAAGARLVDLYGAGIQYVNYKTSDAQQTSFGTWQQNSKIAAAYKADDYGFCANATTVVTDTSTSGLATIDTLKIGHFISGSQLNGHIRQITYIPRRLTNAELQSRTA